MSRSHTSPAPLELWGGIECSVNRVGDRYHNQLQMGGHATRVDDIDRVASLGIRTLRYPFLWELTAPGRDPTAADWAWCDERAERLRELEVRPIAGFLHHGSGPRHTSLIDDAFPAELAAYAGAFARRYPWIDMYTPVNEPLTTARFSGLYGIWYPHRRSGAALARALVNQCRGTVLAMRAIRETNPEARLVQTEDLGHVSSTRVLAYQARHENERRWLTWDLLFGRVDRLHPMWRHLVRWGVRPDELEWFECNPCPPDVIGINHYVTSNRYLDDRVDLFPPEFRGGNGRHDYADVEAVRMLREPGPSWFELIESAWLRYGKPVAITEVHLGCTRDEQMRWLFQCWDAAQRARAAGCDVRAITPWALFGSHDWSSLLTRFDGIYEPGAWDVRAPTPRPTALAGLVADLAAGDVPKAESWLRMPGWWQRDSRLQHSPCRRDAPLAEAESASIINVAAEMRSAQSTRPTVITGATGTLGKAFARACQERGLPHRLVSRSEMDISNPSAVAAVMNELHPIAVINTAGYVRVDDAEDDRDRCERENHLGPRLLAEACAQRDLPFVTFSSDLVFDGLSTTPYLEDDPIAPLCAYGEAKARAESAVLDGHPNALVVRTSAFFGPWDEYNFLTQTLRALQRGETVLAPADLNVSPTYVPDLTHASLDLLQDRESGLWHLANRGGVSWYEFARMAAIKANVPHDTLVPVPWRELGWRASRPLYSVLGTSRGHVMPTLETAIGRYLRATGFLESLPVAA